MQTIPILHLFLLSIHHFEINKELVCSTYTSPNLARLFPQLLRLVFCRFLFSAVIYQLNPGKLKNGVGINFVLHQISQGTNNYKALYRYQVSPLLVSLSSKMYSKF